MFITNKKFNVSINRSVLIKQIISKYFQNRYVTKYIYFTHISNTKRGAVKSVPLKEVKLGGKKKDAWG